ncbi:MAG: cupin domain-containing protein [Alphaproteobacteria bacterium]|nr:cupin domain-containing protein [Alphaproteobacteria bacterium]
MTESVPPHSAIRPLTETERATFPRSVIIDMPESFDDPRGSIQPLVDETMESAVLISSRRGTVRANHYHKTDWHYCYVLSGRIEYHHRPHSSTEAPETVTVEAGQLFFTPPMVDHAMVFLEDTVFLTLGRNSRLQEVYEADVERIEMVPAT